jgi:hypothetical protein
MDLNPKEADLRGLTSEDAVDGALFILRLEGQIKSYHRVRRNSYFDSQGIDFFIHFYDGNQMPLQVKSSNSAAKQYRKERRRKNIEVYPVVVAQGNILGKLKWLIFNFKRGAVRSC